MKKEKPKETGIALISVQDAAIAKLKEEFSSLKIAGIDDKDGYKKVHASRMIVKNLKIDVKKESAGLVGELKCKISNIKSEESRIIELLDEVYNPLDVEESAHKEAIEVAKKEVEAAKVRKIQDRCGVLFGLGCAYDGSNYSFLDIHINDFAVGSMPDNNFDSFVNILEQKVEAENDRLVEIERIAKEEAARIESERIEAARVAQEKRDNEAAELAKQKAEQDKKAKELKLRQDAMDKQQADIKKQQDDLAKEKQEAIDRKNRAGQARVEMLLSIGVNLDFQTCKDMSEPSWNEFYDLKNKEYQTEQNRLFVLKLKEDAEKLESEKKAAADKAVQGEKYRVEAKRLADELSEKKRIAAEKKAARLAPDKEKLTSFIAEIKAVQVPKLACEESKEIAKGIMELTDKLIGWIELKANEL